MIIKRGLAGMLLFLSIVFSVHTSVGQSELGKIKCVCIDAGHGGKDPGAVGTKAYEKNIVLAVALKVGKQIEKAYPDIKVVYIRDADFFVELKERTRIANQHKADLFISVHANSLDLKERPNGKYTKGVETYVMGLNYTEHNLKVAMKENSVIHYEDDYSVKYEGFDPSRPESYILFNMLRSMHSERSLLLASSIQQEMLKSTRQKDREVAQGPMWVLKDVAMPAVLVEIGYMTNPEEELFMTSSTGQTKIAQGIFNGFQVYKDKVEKKAASSHIEKTMPEQQEEGPVYAIQVASSVSPAKSCAKLCPNHQVYELESGGRYRYYVAPSTELEKVKDCLKTVKTKVKDCFIIAIHEGKVIPVAEAGKLKRK